MITLKVITLPGIVKDVTIFNDEIIKGINAMPVKDRLEVLFGIDLEKTTTKKELLVAVINNLLNSDLSIHDNIAILAYFKYSMKAFDKKNKKLLK